jgi:hypothetical protein
MRRDTRGTLRLTETDLRRLVRGLLREADMSGKPLALVQRLVDINSEIEAAGLDVEIGLMTYRNSRGGDTITFAARASGGEAVQLDTESAHGHEVGHGIFNDLNKSHSELYARIPYGALVTRTRNWLEDGPCAGARIVNYTNPTLKGWGPLLYDLALELSSQAASGLTPDRGSVSPAALAVWDKYANSRNDVKVLQLDRRPPLFPPGERQLTPDIEADDCDQYSSELNRGLQGWSDSVLSRVYRKEGSTVMSALEGAGLLWRP